MNTRTFTYSVYLTSILVAALTPAPTLADTPGKARAYQTPVNEKTAGNSKKRDSTPKSNEPAKSTQKLQTVNLNGLHHLSVWVEQLEKSTGLTFTDSAYILLPATALRKKMPVILKVRLIATDSAGSTAQDYRLVLDLTKYTTSLNAPGKQPPSHAPLPAGANKDSAATLPITSRQITPAGNTSALPLTTTPGSTNNFWQKLVFLGSGLAGLFGLLWATSRFLVFSVTVKPGNSENNGLDTNFPPDYPVSPEPVLIQNKQVEEDTKLPVAASEGSATKAIMPKVDASPVAIKEPRPASHMEAAGSAAERYFFTELLLTAGPRKKYMSDPEADKDLGEDACGLVANGQQLLLWVLDGTSDQYCLRNPLNKREYFSSRLLAQGLSNKLRTAFTQLASTSLDKVLLQAVQAVKTDWLRQIQALPAEEQAIIKINIEQKNIPECATTLLIGTLAINGELLAYRSGDCKMVLYTRQRDGRYQLLKTPLTEKNEDSNDRLFFRLIINPQGELDILHNTPKYEIIKQPKVHTAIAFSDGIGLETEAQLKEPENKSLAAIREEIVYQLQGTADDKAICFVEIREEVKL